jgi:hypothetical protein
MPTPNYSPEFSSGSSTLYWDFVFAQKDGNQFRTDGTTLAQRGVRLA